MLSGLRSLLWGRGQQEGASPRPDLHQLFPADEPRADDQRRWFEGAVLACSPEGGTVAGDVWFGAETVRGRPPAVGDRVYGEAWRRDSSRAWLALHVEVCDDEWADERGPAEARVVGQVVRFDGEVLILADRGTEYRLHQAGVEVDFTPQEGDWLEMESESEIPLEVTADSSVQVRPLRRWELDGEVTFVSHEPPVFGIVSNQVYFYAAAWTLPRLPRRGDRVRCNAVESSQTTTRGVTLNWRALRVTALEARAWLHQPAPVVAAAPSAASEQLLQDKRGVSVSGGDFGHLKCGECRRAALVVRNSGSETVVLRSARLLSDSAGQFGVVVDDESAIVAGAELAVPVECRARLLGAGRSLCVLQFGDFQLGRWLSVHVQDPDMHRLKVTAPGRRHGSTALVSELDARQGCVVVPGQPAFKPAPFVSARLPPYPLPPRLLSMDGDQLLLSYPCLADPLRADNYRQRLDLLLYIEEVEMVRCIRRFDMQGVALTRAGEYLQLTVPGLAESRPSIVVGDKVLLSHPFEEDGVKYEGHVHEVRHSALRLLFHPDFQQRYTGQEYNAQFEFSRSQMRQLHRAVETALARLGPDLLFPDRAPARLPQVAFIEEFCQPSDPAVCSHKKRVSFDLSERRPAPAAETTALANGTAGPPPGPEEGVRGAGRVDPPRCPEEGVRGAGTADPEGAPTLAEVADQSVSDVPESEVTPTNSPRHPAVSEEGCLESGSELAQSGTTPTNSPEHRLSAPPKHQVTAPRNGLTRGDVDDVVAALTRQSSESADTAPPERTGPQQPEPADLEDSLSVTSGSDASFASVDCFLDESHYASASCASLTETPQGKRRTRRRRRLAVVDRLFHSPAQRPVGEAGGGDASDNGHGTQSPAVSDDIVVNGLGTEQTTGNTGVRSDNGPRLSCNTINSQKAASPPSPPADANAAAGRCDGAVSRSERLPPPVHTAGAPDSPACPKPLASPLKAPPLSRAASDLRRRALSAVGAAGGRAPFLVPRFTAVPPAEGVTPPRDATFVVPRLAAETGGAAGPDRRLLRWFNPRLNERQRCAVRRVLKGLARPLPYIIYGPPGSGKTVTVVECILQTYTLLPNSRVLVATPSNSAADLITERLHLSGALHKAALVRLTSFNRAEESCPEMVQPYVMSGDSLEAASRRRVIVGTAAAVGNLHRLGLRQGHFTHVFLDEAGHMTEPESLVPLGLVSALDGQAVLAGDPQQLGPVLQSRYTAVWGLQTSLLERLSERPLYGRDERRFTDHGCYNPLLVTKLVNNYRSHRELITVPSRLFYHSELVPCAAPDMANKWCHLDWLPKPGFPMLFHGVRGENMQEGDSPSWFNPTEAFQVIRYLQKLGSAGLDWDEVGVISPYRKQTEKIRELIHTFALPTVKVGSVEEFQGQEREVIILTTVRSSEVTLSHDVVYRLGFMQNPRRFNVAVTRAKCLLIVVGNPLLLAADQHWRHLVVHAVTNGAAIGCDGVL